MAHSYTRLYYHAVFATKNRQPWIALDIRQRLYDYMGGIVKAENGGGLSLRPPFGAGGSNTPTGRHRLRCYYPQHRMR